MAVRQLLRVENDAAYVGRLRRDELLDPGARARVLDYVSGVTRWRRRLDFLIDRFYRGDSETLEPGIRHTLRLALYDLLIRDQPPHAVVDESVRLARFVVGRRATGLVNGILRAVVRQRESLPEPDTGDPVEDLAIRLSHPTWMTRGWAERFGLEETERLLRYNNARPVFGVRINTLRQTVEEGRARLDEAGVVWSEARLPAFVRVERLREFQQRKWLEEGWFAVQDEAAALVVRVLDPQPGESLLDVCAAPGGKSLYAAALMENRGRIRALDVHPGRLELVVRMARRQGVEMLESAQQDGRTLSADTYGTFDRVLLDVPCSGTGVLGKRADLRWRRTPEDLVQLTALQDDLLEGASRCVRPGGLLLYATCSLEPEENELRVRAFLSRHPEFGFESAAPYVDAELVSDDGFYRTQPHRHGIDGAFAARLRRVEA